jgi:TolB protein
MIKSKLLWLFGASFLLALVVCLTYLIPHPNRQLNVKEVTPSMPDSNWQIYTNPFFKIKLKYPPHWKLVDGEPRYGERFAGEDGYFTITAMGDVGLTLDQAVEVEIQHKLQPYGPEPYVEEFQVQGQAARIISPSASQDDHLRWQAGLLVLYPQPISLTTGDTEHVYPIFALYADPAHIWGIAESLRFDVDLFEESETIDTLKDNLSCLVISETPESDCWPENYSVIRIKEQNRRGSFIAYHFHIEGVSQTPYLSEIQLFSEESIETFTSNCDSNTPCFFGDYPTPKRYADMKAAFTVPTSYQDYALKRFGDRYFVVKNLSCYGDDCFIREYTTFLGDVMAVFWIVMADEVQADLSDQLFIQVIIGWS